MTPSSGVHVLTAARVTPEILRDASLRRARVLERAARREAAAGEGAAAVVMCWGSDIATVQATLMERLVIEARAPQRQYFGAVERLSEALTTATSTARTAAEVVRATREHLLAAVDASEAHEIAGQVTDPTFLEALGAPTPADFAALTERRLQGHSAADFARQRLREATELMVQAQGERLRGDDATAIQAAYQSDFRALEAYLVQSALAVGDMALLTVETRWELAVAAMQDLSSLSADFPTAIGEIRVTVAAALGEPDATRLAGMLSAV